MPTLRTSPCNVCPRLCNARRDEGQRGVCGANNDVYVARAALHYWEEPPLSGDAGSGAVFFSNCPLHCVYCQNSVIANGTYGERVSVERLSEIFLELQSQGALNINCVTPTHYSMQIREAVHMSRERGLALPVVWNTSGYERVETVRELSDTVDIYLADFKYATPHLAKEYSNARDYVSVALAAIDEMVKSVGAPVDTNGFALPSENDDSPAVMARGVMIRHLLLPGALEQSKKALDIVHSRYGSDVLVSIMNQYTPVLASAAEGGDAHAKRVLEAHPELGSVVPDSEYEQLLDYADSIGMEDYYWQEGPAAKESFVPAWDATGVLPK